MPPIATCNLQALLNLQSCHCFTRLERSLIYFVSSHEHSGVSDMVQGVKQAVAAAVP
ncbi:hypothetical protein M408DRAFT_241576 [Serendipita vermifera MAFF 305830]|uniref:Uncharacterized protein n=1 Tax=Serendipita vermifera MAFF 305830 TaxID=933852 RepID=A0A0C3B569_SERVB|nr:hypothetical protein M408DRAFT_241576 [Serendipita vermifera MAFF 305830]